MYNHNNSNSINNKSDNINEPSNNVDKLSNLTKDILRGYAFLVTIFYAYHYLSSIGIEGVLSRVPLLPLIEALAVYFLALILSILGGVFFSMFSGYNKFQSIKMGVAKTNIVASLVFLLMLGYVQSL